MYKDHNLGSVASWLGTLYPGWYFENNTCVPHSALFMVYFDCMVMMSLCLHHRHSVGLGITKALFDIILERGESWSVAFRKLLFWVFAWFLWGFGVCGLGLFQGFLWWSLGLLWPVGCLVSWNQFGLCLRWVWAYLISHFILVFHLNTNVSSVFVQDGKPSFLCWLY